MYDRPSTLVIFVNYTFFLPIFFLIFTNIISMAMSHYIPHVQTILYNNLIYS